LFDKVLNWALVLLISFIQNTFGQTADLELVAAFGSRGSAIGQFDHPGDLVVDAQDRIIVADRVNHRIQICDDDGECSAFGEKGTELGQFDWPMGVALDEEGHIVVADYNNERIQVCDHEGQCGLLQNTEGPGALSGRPQGIAFDSQGRLHVVGDNYTICTPAIGCSIVAEDAGPDLGSFYFSPGVAVDRYDRAVIADQFGNRVLRCTDQGDCTQLFGDVERKTPLPPGAFNRPHDVAIDNEGWVYVMDTYATRLQICIIGENCFVYSGGNGNYNRESGEFALPEGLALGQTGKIHVADTENHRIQIFELIEMEFRFPIQEGMSGAWYNPATSGQGFFINVLAEGERMFLGWFTYDLERPVKPGDAQMGEAGHRWLTAQGQYSEDTASLNAYLTEGGRFMSMVPAPTTESIGTINILFKSCTEARLDYALETKQGPIAGSIHIQKLANANLKVCEELAAKNYPH